MHNNIRKAVPASSIPFYFTAIILPILIIVFLLSALIVARQHTALVDRERERYESQAEAFLINALTEAIWDFREKDIEAIVQQIQSFSFIEGTRVLFGEEVIASSGAFPINAEIKKLGLGVSSFQSPNDWVLEIHQGPDNNWSFLLEAVKNAIIPLLVTFSLFLIVLHYSFRKYISGPTRSLRSALVQYSDRENIAKDLVEAGPLEIRELIAGYNRMANQIAVEREFERKLLAQSHHQFNSIRRLATHVADPMTEAMHLCEALLQDLSHEPGVRAAGASIWDAKHSRFFTRIATVDVSISSVEAIETTLKDITTHPPERVSGEHIAADKTVLNYQIIYANDRIVGVIALDMMNENTALFHATKVYQLSLSSITKLIYEAKARTAIEEQLHSVKSQMYAAIDAIDIGVLHLDDDGDVIVGNKIFYTFIWPELRRQLNAGILHLAIRDLTETACVNLEKWMNDTNNPAHRDADLELETLDGSWLNITRSKPEDGGQLLFLRDVSEIKAQDIVHRRNERLSSLGQLVSGIAHDFNNILTVVGGNAELLALRFSGENEAKKTHEIVRAVQSGSKLTRSLLSFARQAPLDEGPVNINEITSATMDWGRRVLPSSIEIDVVLDSSLWQVWADSAMLENALLNLVLNARDAMPNGGKLTVETANYQADAEDISLDDETLSPGRHVMLAVSDTGQGISKENLNKIFDPFFTTKGRNRSTSIGLAALHGFMEQSRGTTRVYSEVGIGSSFKLFFPAMKSDQLAAAQPAVGEIEPSAGVYILLVEDKADLRRVLSEMLETGGYNVISATSGDGALDVVDEDSNIDIVLTNITMPGRLNGLELVRELRAIWPHLPAVYMSGYAHEAGIHGDGLRPEDVKLSKPMSRAGLFRAIEKALKANSSGRPVARSVKSSKQKGTSHAKAV